MNLGQLAGHYYAHGGTKYAFQIGQRLQNPVRRFVKNQGARGLVPLHFGGQRFQPGSPRAGLLRQKADEVKLARGQSGGDQRAERRIGSGDGNDRDAGGNGLGRQPASGVADARHSGVGDHGDAPAGLERGDQFTRRADARCAGGSSRWEW